MFCMNCGKPIQFVEDLPELEIADCVECNTRFEMTPHDDQDGSMSIMMQSVESIDLAEMPKESLRWSSANPPTSPTKTDRETKPLAGGHMTDEGNPSAPSLPFKVTQETYGISVVALDDTGHQLGEVLLDYHGNRLACMCYHPDIDDVVSTTVFCDDVKKARKGKKPKKE